MRLSDLVDTSCSIAQTRSRSSKIARLAECLRQMTPEEIPGGVALLSGSPRQGKVGIGLAALSRAGTANASGAAGLELIEVDRAFGDIAAIAGPGAESRRNDRLGTLLALATGEEREFLLRVAIGELRQGALEALVGDAIAVAFAVPGADVRRAAMMCGDLGEVARAAAERGSAGLAAFGVELFRPLQPMLAQPTADLDAALEELGEASLEWKIDGARVQIHKSGDDVAVFTRRRHAVTPAVPEIVEAVRALPARELILDGEAIALRGDGRPHPFQTTMRRFGRRLEVAALRAELPLATFAFDLLWLDGASLLAAPAADRWEALSRVVPASLRVPRLRSADREEAHRFLESALAAGHEGIMAKALDHSYEAGRRGQAWLKVKSAHTLDLVVLAAEWGHGRRRGWLSNLHLGARDPVSGGWVMLGKTFKGMTDEMLAWQTERLLALEVSRDSWTVYVRPELVAEVAFNDVQASPRYPGGLALRFARVKHYRPDKVAADANDVEHVRMLLPAAEACRDGG